MRELIEFHPRLVEEAVWCRVRGHPSEREFHRRREEIYRETWDDRDRAFARFHLRWFRRFALDEPVDRALEELRGPPDALRRLVFVPAVDASQEGAELFVAGPEDRSVVVRILAATLADGTRALELLRRELMHVADMLDPAFEYDPVLPASRRGPSSERLLRDRYRVLWDCTVDGRLTRLGHLGPAARDRRLREFRRVFAALGESAEECFDGLFRGPRPSHPGLLSMTIDPAASFGLESAQATRPSRCPLCGFPTPCLETDASALPGALCESIRSEFPEWSPERGICLQCAELYRTRSVSLASARRLPRA